jgi:hypothetical protein
MKVYRNTTYVYAYVQFEGFHRWKDAQHIAQVNYLQYWHRHMFHVHVYIEVGGLNREVEFIQLKEKVNNFVQSEYAGKSFEFSCEQLAKQIADRFDAVMVRVSEDGENGALLLREEIESNIGSARKLAEALSGGK